MNRCDVMEELLRGYNGVNRMYIYAVVVDEIVSQLSEDGHYRLGILFKQLMEKMEGDI